MAATKGLDEVPDGLTVENGSEVLRSGRNAAYELVRTGGLFAVLTGGRSLRVPEAALVAYLGEMDWQEAGRRPLRAQSFPEILLSDRGSVASGRPAPTDGSW